MNSKMLANVIYKRARKLYDDEVEKTGNISAETADISALLKVLVRILEGKPVARAFGAPGDWGYGTPIGDALAAKETSAQVEAIEA